MHRIHCEATDRALICCGTFKLYGDVHILLCFCSLHFSCIYRYVTAHGVCSQGGRPCNGSHDEALTDAMRLVQIWVSPIFNRRLAISLRSPVVSLPTPHSILISHPHAQPYLPIHSHTRPYKDVRPKTVESYVYLIRNISEQYRDCNYIKSYVI